MLLNGSHRATQTPQGAGGERREGGCIDRVPEWEFVRNRYICNLFSDYTMCVYILNIYMYVECAVYCTIFHVYSIFICCNCDTFDSGTASATPRGALQCRYRECM